MGKWHEITGESQTGQKFPGCAATLIVAVLAILGGIALVIN